MIKDNLEAVWRNIAEAAKRAGRKAQDITLVCVTKEANISQIKEAIAYGVTDIGENRVQDAIEKSLKLKALSLKFHFIGHLQTNKVKKAVEIFDLIHSVDSLRLAEEISKEAAKIDKIQDILIEVNTSGEENKFGIRPEELNPLIDNIVGVRHALPLRNIKLLGLMTMAPLVRAQEDTRFCFRRLKELSTVFVSRVSGLGSWQTPNPESRTPILSMGMSQDYQVAIEEGATMVRIGSAIFK